LRSKGEKKSEGEGTGMRCLRRKECGSHSLDFKAEGRSPLGWLRRKSHHESWVGGGGGERKKGESNRRRERKADSLISFEVEKGKKTMGGDRQTGPEYVTLLMDPVFPVVTTLTYKKREGGNFGSKRRGLGKKQASEKR